MKTALVIIGILIAIALGATSLVVNLNRQGKQGIQGLAGGSGTQGIQGIAGLNGKNGLDGKNGINGVNGKDGAQGIQGLTGAVGATGAQGIQGATGAMGAQGIRGVAGTSVEYRSGTGEFTVVDGVGTCVVVFSTPLSTTNYSIAILGNGSYTISNQTVAGFTVTSDCAPIVWFAIVNK